LTVTPECVIEARLPRRAKLSCRTLLLIVVGGAPLVTVGQRVAETAPDALTTKVCAPAAGSSA
jgi:hypothetical protein